MVTLSTRSFGRLTASAVAVATVAAGLLIATAAPAGASAGAVYSSVGTTFQVALRGNGHGHGMSQYGAQGAAGQGLRYRQILHFYYPNARIRTWSPFRISVLVSNTGTATTVAAQRGLHVTGIAAALPTKHVSRYRLVAAGTGIELLSRASGRRWKKVRGGLPSSTAFRRHGTVRLYLADGTSTAYHGSIAGVRRAGATSLMTINRVSIDDYVAGVVPREMPAYWHRAALQAQAVAARSFARYSADHASGAYDVCDTTNCQVYGGAVHYAGDGSVLWTDDQAAVAGDENMYLTYRHAAILAQFSASNGGWTVDGGEPYLIAQHDPYDNAASGDPYLGYRETIRRSWIASYFGLKSVSGIAITARDGHGAWGGRVTAARITGRDSSGAKKTVRTDGFNLQWAMGVGTTWFTLVANNRPRGRLESVRREGAAVRVNGWAIDADHTSHSPPMRIRIDGRIVARFRTHTARPRIVHRFALHYGKPGFRRLFHPGPGRHHVCATALDTDGRRRVRLGCAMVRIHR